MDATSRAGTANPIRSGAVAARATERPIDDAITTSP
jgi:hypothetical protein